MTRFTLLLCAVVPGLMHLADVCADDIGVDIAAITYDFESQPDNDFVIKDMGTAVGYVRAENSFEYWGYDNFDFGGGATHLTVRAASATQGGRLHVRLQSFYNPMTTIATVDIPYTGGWDSFEDFTVEVDQDVLQWLGNGRTLLFVVEQEENTNYLFDVESFRFDNLGDIEILAAEYDSESYPSDDNIIRDMGTKVGYITNGSYIRFNNVNLDGAVALSLLASSASEGGVVHVTSQAPMGFAAAQHIATIDVRNTGGWDVFEEFSANLTAPLSGSVNSLYLSFEGDSNYLFDLQLIRFSRTPLSDVGVDIPAAAYAFESAPDDDDVIVAMGDAVGYIKADGGTEYWGYENFEFGSGASTFTVRAASGSEGGILHVRLANHYNIDLTVATVDIPYTGGWDSFQEFTVPVNQDVIAQLGGRTLFFVVNDDETTDYQFDIASFRFDN